MAELRIRSSLCSSAWRLTVLNLVAVGSLSAQIVSFIAGRDFAVGNQSISVVVGDFNGDAKLDLFVANQAPADGLDTPSVLINNTLP